MIYIFIHDDDKKAKKPKVDLSLSHKAVQLDSILESVERALIDLAMDRSGQIKTHACKLLGIKRTTLIEKMRRLGYKLNPASKDKK